MKRLGVLFLFTIILALVLIMGQVVQSQPLAVVQGQLKDQTGTPLAYHPVIIEGLASPTWQFWRNKQVATVKALTDEKGVFHVIDLPAGIYTVKALRPGSEPLPIGQFETPYGYQKIDVSNKLKVLRWDFDPSERYRLPAPSGVLPQPESGVMR